MNHGSLFSGIGGFDLAANWAGWTNIFHCEKNPFGKQILSHYWPTAISYDDITTADFTIHRGEIDVLTGGFPCQPFSQAGSRKGTEDDRHLWPQMLRAIREIQPRYVVGENVRGIINWNRGMVFNEVQADLENEGYEVLPFLLPAASVGAPHERYRVWFIAYADGKRRRMLRNESQATRPQESNELSGSKHRLPHKPIANSRDKGLQGSELNGALNADRNKQRWQSERQPHKPTTKLRKAGNWQNFPTQPPICGGNDGLPAELDGITFSKWRNESIKAYGNAIVPEVALQIFNTINQIEWTKPCE